MIHYSFKEFFIAIGLLTFAYLAFILLRYYRKEMNTLISSKRGLHQDEQEDEEIFGPYENISAENSGPSQTEDFKRAETIIPKIKEAIIYASVNNLEQGELYDSLKAILTQNPIVNDPVIREGIGELILFECEKHGAVKPEQRELSELWEIASA